MGGQARGGASGVRTLFSFTVAGRNLTIWLTAPELATPLVSALDFLRFTTPSAAAAALYAAVFARIPPLVPAVAAAAVAALAMAPIGVTASGGCLLEMRSLLAASLILLVIVAVS